jgi:quercetin dioxygenase-like cupin family protein
MASYRHVKAGEARTFEVIGHREEILCDTKSATVFVNWVPKGIGVPMHAHPDMDEGCLVMDGILKFVAGEEVLTAGPGDYVYVERGIPHGFVAVDDAKLLWTCTPGGYGAFFEDLAAVPVSPGGPDFAAVAATCAKHGIEVLGPPPAL